MKTSGKMGRPRKGKEERIIRIVVKLSVAEAAPILRAAESETLPRAVWARRALIRQAEGEAGPIPGRSG